MKCKWVSKGQEFDGKPDWDISDILSQYLNAINYSPAVVARLEDGD